MGFNVENIINHYIIEYISLAQKLGFFKNDYISNKYYHILKSTKIIFDDNLPRNGAVFKENNQFVLYINPSRLFSKDEAFIYEVIFHEFTHILNNIHRDLFLNSQSLLKQYKNSFINTMRTKFNKNYINCNITNNNVKNPFIYILQGCVLLDEAICQNVAEEMISYKFNTPRIKQIQTCPFADITYETDFNEYGIYQSLAETFAKTIRGISNLNDLSKAAFDENFTNNLISEHTESAFTYEALYKKLSYLGVIYFAQESYNGHINYSNSEDPYAVDRIMAKNAYNSAITFCNEGIDNRKEPSYKKLLIKNNQLTW